MKRRGLPSLNALRAFEAFSRHGRMASAAEELCVTHGAVSRLVRQLEAALGVALVDGPKTRLQLTPEGVRLAAALSPSFDGIALAVDELRTSSLRTLNVSCLGTFAMRWLIPRLGDFLERHPNVRVSITESRAPVDFRRDGVDAAIRMARPSDRLAAEVTPFLPHHHGPVLAASLGEAGMPLDRLATLPRLHTRTYPAAWEEWQATYGCKLGPAPRDETFDHNYYLVEAVNAGLGVAIGAWPFVNQDIATGRLVAPFGFLEGRSRYVLLAPEGKVDPALSLFRDWLVGQGEATPPPPVSPRPAPRP